MKCVRVLFVHDSVKIQGSQGGLAKLEKEVKYLKHTNNVESSCVLSGSSCLNRELCRVHFFEKDIKIQHTT